MEGPLTRLANSRLLLHSPTCTPRDRRAHKASNLRHPGSRSPVESHQHLPTHRHQVRRRRVLIKSHSRTRNPTRNPSLSLSPTRTPRDRRAHKASQLCHHGSRSPVKSHHHLHTRRHQVKRRRLRIRSRTRNLRPSLSPTCTPRGRRARRVSQLCHPGKRSPVESHHLPTRRHRVRLRRVRIRSRTRNLNPSLSIKNLPAYISLTPVLALQVMRHRRLRSPQTSINISSRTRLPRTKLRMLQPTTQCQAKPLWAINPNPLSPRVMTQASTATLGTHSPLLRLVHHQRNPVPTPRISPIMASNRSRRPITHPHQARKHPTPTPVELMTTTSMKVIVIEASRLVGCERI